MISITNTPAFSLAYLEAVRDIQYQMVAALSFMVWDLLLTFAEEVEFIWRMRRCMFKWLYFYFRYFLLAVQIFHLAISPSLSSGRTPDFLCMVWCRYIVFMGQLSITLLDVVLASRVFALFNCSHRVGIFLGSLILLDLVLAGVHMLKYTTVEYFEACMLLKPQTNLAKAHTTSVMIIQSTIMGMIMFKQSVGLTQGWGRTPLLSFLIRDVSSNYIAVFLLCSATLAIFGLDQQRSISVFYWSTPLFSAVGCRLILNMERFARRYPAEEEILLTSHITL